jgi:hypothetical protein
MLDLLQAAERVPYLKNMGYAQYVSSAHLHSRMAKDLS